MTAFTRLLKSVFASRPQTPIRRPAAAPRLGMEALEAREVPAVLVGRTLSVTGTGLADTIRVSQSGSTVTVSEKLGSAAVKTQTFAASQIDLVKVVGGDGNDAIDVSGIRIKADLYGGTGNDRLYGGTLADTISGWTGDDLIYGNEGNDLLYGGENNDTMYGGPGDDTLHGSTGNDYLKGGLNGDRDLMYGWTGNDTLVGEAGLDKLNGWLGNDRMEVSLDLDDLLAGRGASMAASDNFQAGNGTDTVAVTLDLDSFARRMLAPALAEVRRTTAVFDPVVNLLNRKIPVLSQFDGSLTFGKLLSQYKPEVGKFLAALNTVRSLSSSASLGGSVSLGEFTINSGSTPGIGYRVASKLAGIGNSVLTAARNAGVRFGLIDDPTSAVRLLLGQKVDLVTYSLSLPSISAGLSKKYEVSTGIPGVNAMLEFGGTLSASARATVGLDSSGFWNGNVLGGFFVRDAVARVGATAYVRGGVSLGVPNFISIGSIYGYGTLGGTINFSLANGGKVYASNLSSYSSGLKVSGQIDYNLGFGVKYKWWKGTDHKNWLGIVYTTYAWHDVKHEKSLGSGTFRV